ARLFQSPGQQGLGEARLARRGDRADIGDYLDARLLEPVDDGRLHVVLVTDGPDLHGVLRRARRALTPGGGAVTRLAHPRGLVMKIRLSVVAATLLAASAAAAQDADLVIWG